MVARTKWTEYVLRFLFGGFSTILAGLVARFAGPAIGGLFLAFPAIFCASVTLVERHERERKEQLGFEGRRRGRLAAALEATGAGLGAIGLIVFGAMVWLLAGGGPVAALGAALFGWFVTAMLLWRLRRSIGTTK